MSNRYSTVDPTQMPPAPRRAVDDYYVKVARPVPQRPIVVPESRQPVDLKGSATTALTIAKQIVKLPFKIWWFLFRAQFTLRYWGIVFAVAIIAGLIQNA